MSIKSSTLGGGNYEYSPNRSIQSFNEQFKSMFEAVLIGQKSQSELMTLIRERNLANETIPTLSNGMYNLDLGENEQIQMAFELAEAGRRILNTQDQIYENFPESVKSTIQ